MSVVISSSYVIGSVATDGGVIDGNNPIIGWDNILVGGDGILVTTTADPDFPVSNLLTNSTNLKWKGDATEVNEFIQIDDPGAHDIDYIAIARHNLGSELIPISVEAFVGADSFTKVLLHMAGADGSTTFTDSSSSPKTFTASGNAQIDTSTWATGLSSGLFDGTGDFISAPDHADFALGSSDWTVEAWFRCTGASGTAGNLAGQSDPAAGFATSSFWLSRTAGNVIVGNVSDGSAIISVTGTTQFTDVLNTGWHHAALVRVGNILRLFVDGVQEGGDVAFVGSVPNSTEGLYVGTRASSGGTVWTGSIDEFRLSVGIARYTANFTPTVVNLDWELLIADMILPNDGPAIFRFPKLAYSNLRLRLQVDLEEPVIAVIYCGELLVLQRRIYVGHSPINYNVNTRVVNGRSESGDFLGRIVLTEMTSTQLELINLSPGWFRDYMAPFLEFARGEPFFMAWRPEDYAHEVGYCWLTNDPRPTNQRARGHMQLTLEMGGVT